MYAVIETGGKQYRVEVGTELEVELLEAEAGQSVTLERVLLVADGAEAAIGTPLVADAAVEAEVVGRERGEKIIAFKYRPKARRRVKKGHRQELTRLRIADIRFQGRSAAEGVTTAPRKGADRKRLEEAAARQAAEDAALAAKLNVGATDQEPAKEITAKAAKETPAKAAKEIPAKAAKQAPAKAAKQAPAKAAKEAPAKAAKETTAKPARRTRGKAAGPDAAAPPSEDTSAKAAETGTADAEAPATAEGGETARPATATQRRTRAKAADAPAEAGKADVPAKPAADQTSSAPRRRSRTKKDE